MMKLLKNISLWVVGLTFAFSGFVKAIDPIGGAIKFTDYFNAFHLNALEGIALPLAVLLATAEFMIGILLLMRIWVKQLALPTLLLMSFFTILTLVLAIFNPVTDCGCFGDAIKLTNWQTFGKNMIVLPFSILIFIQRKDFINPIKRWSLAALVAASVLIILWVSYQGLAHQPLIDFRPYKIGTNIPEAMSVPEGAQAPEYLTTFILEKEGVRKEFGISDYPYTDTTWVFVESINKQIKAGYEPPIQNFALQSATEGNFTERLLAMQKPVFLMIAPKLEKADLSNLDAMVKLYLLCRKYDYGFYCVTSSLPDQILEFDIRSNVGFDYLLADETMLKTITRNNPGLLLLQNGTILGKWNANDIDDADKFANPVQTAVSEMRAQNEKLSVLSIALLLLALYIFTIRYNN